MIRAIAVVSGLVREAPTAVRGFLVDDDRQSGRNRRTHLMPNSLTEQKPGRIRQAQRYLAMFLGIEFVKMLLELSELAGGMSHTGIVAAGREAAVSLLRYSLWAFLVYFILNGKNFARVTFVFWFGVRVVIFGVFVFVFMVTDCRMPVCAWVGLAAYTIQLLLGIMACLCLLNNEAEAWFKAMEDSAGG